MLHPFAYHRPIEMSGLLAFLKEHGEQAALISGGTDLLVNIRGGVLKPEHVVDLKGVESLKEVSFDAKTGLSIGACVTVNQLIANPEVQKHYPILVAAGSELATVQLRNRATVVGNIVTASPCGDMTSPLLCLAAEIDLLSASGARSMLISEFITGVKTTRIAPDEIVERIRVPLTYADASAGYKKLKRIRGHDLGVVAVAMIKSNGTVRAAISSAAPTPVLLPDLPSDTPIETIQDAASKAISPIDDVRCTREYREFMVGVYLRRLMEEVQE
jgi:carbon-monoxide dehydrogenase medium subunit